MLDKDKLIEAMAEAISMKHPDSKWKTEIEVNEQVMGIKFTGMVAHDLARSCAEAALHALINELPEIETIHLLRNPPIPKDNAKELYQQLKDMGK